jgi:hypothetical protein
MDLDEGKSITKPGSREIDRHLKPPGRVMIMPFIILEDGRKMPVRVMEAGKVMALVEYFEERRGIEYFPSDRKHWTRRVRWVRSEDILDLHLTGKGDMMAQVEGLKATRTDAELLEKVAEQLEANAGWTLSNGLAGVLADVVRGVAGRLAVGEARSCPGS